VISFTSTLVRASEGSVIRFAHPAARPRCLCVAAALCGPSQGRDGRESPMAVRPTVDTPEL